MRLPTDATLLAGPGAPPELEAAWREERLPTAPLETDLETLATATLVVFGSASVAAAAAALGFRTFLVGDAPAPEGVRAVGLAETVAGARAARNRERWKAARASGP